jgi:integrase/recombinase XerD
VVPLALLDEPDARVKLAAAVADRAAHADARTVNRELSALRSAVGWWQDKGWICGDPVTGLRHLAREPEALPALTDEQLAALWRCGAGLREHALWRLIYDSGAPAAAVLALDAGSLDLPAGRVRVIREPGVPIKWSEHTGELLAWLLSGRKTGPVFRTDRRAPPRYQSKDLCPLTGRARMSYRRAAEIFTERTRRLDPAGAGWTLSQLRRPAGR